VGLKHLQEGQMNKDGSNAWPYQTMWMAAFVIKNFDIGVLRND
jgi:hypothetical protein